MGSGDSGDFSLTGGETTKHSFAKAPKATPSAPATVHARKLLSSPLPVFVDKIRLHFPIHEPESFDNFDKPTASSAEAWPEDIAPGLYLKAYRHKDSHHGEIEFNPSRTTPNATATDTRNVVGKVLAQIAEQYMIPAATDGYIPITVKRLDLARDFHDVAHFGALTHALAPLRRSHTPRAELWHSRGNLSGLTVGTASGQVRLYDRSQVSDDDTVRVEFQLNQGWLAGTKTRPSLQRMEELTDTAIRDVYTERWDWSRLGTPVMDPSSCIGFLMDQYADKVVQHVGRLAIAAAGYKVPGSAPVLREFDKVRSRVALHADLNGTVRLSLAAGTEIFTPPPRKILTRPGGMRVTGV